MKLSLAFLGLLSALLGGRSAVHSADEAVPILISAAVPQAQAQAVNYTDPYDGAALRGYVVLPPSSSPPKGFVAIIPDWDGVNEYEVRRASMLAEELGYAALAADVYGVEEYNPTEMADMIRLSGHYRNNLTLSSSRIVAAINLMKGMPEYIDGAGVAIMGYCFGGSIALNHALSGAVDAKATIAFHGGVSNVRKDFNVSVMNPVAIFSGGEDTQDSTASVVEIEEALNVGGGTWEIDRYSDVGHGFTVFDGRMYNEYVDGRSWDNAKRFLEEAFGNMALEANVPATFAGEDIVYSDPVDGTQLNGFVSLPSSMEEGETFPAVVIVHDADGIDDYEKTRAQMLADLGYVGFAADIYGPKKVGVDMADWSQVMPLLVSFRSDPTLFVQRMKAAVEAAKEHPRVDPDKIGMIGYCFGGTGVMYYAVTGQSDVRGVVSFHGGLIPELTGPRDDPPTIHARMNIQSGGDDDTSSNVEDLEKAMEQGNATWEYARYSDVVHSFTNWDADMEGNRYNLRADVRSWESTKTFLAEAFKDPAEADGAGSTTTTTSATVAANTTGGTTAGSPSTTTTQTAGSAPTTTTQTTGSAPTTTTQTTGSASTTTTAIFDTDDDNDDDVSPASAKSFAAAAASVVTLTWLIV
mmetsp:Transcript_4621/g.12985  ORF Transcript_4621/g.12985 Transcript_4621/m.12985 type:complete len:637 (-) Transcript_4621:514-2424(-)